MNYLVDTNVLSELAKPRPQPGVVAWFRAHEAQVYVGAPTIGELRYGIERLPAGRRKSALQAWLADICETLQGRVLSFDARTAHTWGKLKAQWEAVGVAVPSIDSQIAAVAHRHRLTLATRNTADFARTGIKLFDPFA